MAASIEENLRALQDAIDALRASANFQTTFLAAQQQAADELRKQAPPEAIPTFAVLQQRMNELRASFNAQAGTLVAQQSAVTLIERYLLPDSVIAIDGRIHIAGQDSRSYIDTTMRADVGSFSLIVQALESYTGNRGAAKPLAWVP